LEVEGHTDSVGSDDYNQRLSEQRGEAVRNYLTEQGLPQNSVRARGFGETQPTASNQNAAGRQQNRRVELVRFRRYHWRPDRIADRGGAVNWHSFKCTWRVW
jgi:outer membrane protein OmpA-like peptidoglycan-associated protein